ncbi:hypothetical protein WKI68_39335 [Streptomyces sp. MS1.HAVA.3]|uniref:Protein kinase domain-containing protein n=1 Tax=Streptomyces caledonius TaxID=3134107 RepID=A0ABU8UCM5_9ACTN
MRNTWAVPGYTEVRELGAGGSGRVVLAVHDGTGTAVAVKYLSDRLRQDPAFVGSSGPRPACWAGWSRRTW